MDTPHIIHIHGRHSPPPRLDLTPHATKSTLQQPHGPAKIMRQKPNLLTRLARYHPFGEGHEQARSEHKEKPVNTQVITTAQYTHSTLLKSSNRSMAGGGGKGNNFMHGMTRPAGDLKLHHHSH